MEPCVLCVQLPKGPISVSLAVWLLLSSLDATMMLTLWLFILSFGGFVKLGLWALSMFWVLTSFVMVLSVCLFSLNAWEDLIMRC